MFKWDYTNIFLFFIIDETEKRIPVLEWNKFENENLSQISILNELADNGFAEIKTDRYEAEAAEILKLTDIEKRILSLPDQYPYEIYIESDGQLNQSDFKFKYGFYDFTPNGNRFNARLNGPIIDIEKRRYMLSENQFLVCKALEEFNLLPKNKRTSINNLKRFADIKSFSKKAAAILDGYLEGENVYRPDKIKIDLTFKDGTLEIIPDIDIENKTRFVKSFDIFPKIKAVYNIQDNKGNRTRIVIDEKQKKGLERIKAKRRIDSKDEIDEIVERPEKFFDNETLDLSVFYSERVKEIGIYKPKFYSFICPYKSEWIPGIVIKDRLDGEKRINFKTSIELKEFEAEKEAAIKSEKEFFEWKGVEIFIDDAEKFIPIAKKQLENPKEPISKKEDKVLIIKENVDFLEYVENWNLPEISEFGFSPVKNLYQNIVLKEHQVKGIAWLQTLQQKNLSGCLLADDMGLGKTLQLLYFIEWHANVSQNLKPYLIVAPVTLLENWENEYKKFFSPQSLSLTRLYGKSGLSKKTNKKDIESLQKKHIILTNYETLRNYQLNLGAIDYAVVALDEAQKIKTPGTLITGVCKALKADFKVAMTGTPVENTLVDLWCIMDFSVPGLLGSGKDFVKEFQHPLKKKETDIKELGEKVRGRIGNFIMRRLKLDVAKDLPKKFDNENSKIKRQMPKKQLERYKNEIDLAKSNNSSGANTLKMLWAIRDISDHPFLPDSQIYNFKSEELVATSAKLQILVDLLKNIEEKKDKVIVFADRKQTQRMLQKVISDYFKIYSSIINGDTPATKKNKKNSKLSRQQTIDRFEAKKGFNVIIMSQLSAGIGLNVTKANHVIHYSRHWNPAKEEQATDRAYRIGQQKDVYVYYLMAVSDEFETFDLLLDKLLNRKKELSRNTLFPTEQTEVKPNEIFESVFGFNAKSKQIPLTMKEIDALRPNLFEAYIAVLYSKQGFQACLTPLSNDKGVDVVAIKEGENYLIQVKQSKTSIGNGAVQEVYAAKNYYEKKFDKQFKLIVISNNGFSSSAETLSKSNNVKLINRLLLEKMDCKNKISIQDIYKQEMQRMKRI
ncbi:MAG: restriction endonuclease [Deltaproteobacteria bacterium]|nr:restriction endonuclease [Deltaproteobacteria bacterium]